MIIDLFFLTAAAAAIFKGYSKGFTGAIFSFVGVLLGLVLAVKFSSSVAGWLSNSTGTKNAFLPFAAFILVFVAVAVATRMLSFVVNKSIEMVMLGWLNRVAGITLFFFLYLVILSIILFYINELSLMPTAFESSKSYAFIRPIGPWFIGLLAYIVPAFNDVFEQLHTFFKDS